jgi:hypothetical protein
MFVTRSGRIAVFSEIGVEMAHDETGWKVGGRLCGTRALSRSEATVYITQAWRGGEEAAVLGTTFAGFLARYIAHSERNHFAALFASCSKHALCHFFVYWCIH